MRSDLVGVLLVAAAAFQYGVVIVLGKVLTATVSVPLLLAIRFGIASVLLTGVLTVTNRPLLATARERVRLVLLGSVGYATSAALFFLALHYGQVATVTWLVFTYPVQVALVSAAMGKGAPRGILGVSLASALAGALLVVISSGADIRPVGIGLAVVTSMAYTSYLLGAGYAVHDTEPLTSALWVSVAAGLGSLVFASVGGNLDIPTTFHDWWLLVAMGAGSAGAFVALFTGIARIGPVRTSIVSVLEPASAALLGVLFLGENMPAGTVGGAILILAAAVGAALARTGQEPPIA